MNGTIFDIFAEIFNIVRNNYSVLTFARETFDMIRARMVTILDDPDALISLLTEHLQPLKNEKKSFGEVFTPPDLINEMLDELEVYAPNIWSNPSLRILDPAAGFGNFGALIYGRLMNGLATIIPNTMLRKKHILRNMLFMCEINAKNVRMCERIFHDNHMHLHNGDFLEFDPSIMWHISQFDLIIGNPPYNAPRADRATGNTLYPKFIMRCAKLLASNGYQVMVHPGIWRKPGHQLHDLMFSRHIHYIEIHGDDDGQRTFGANTRYDWYVLQNRQPDPDARTTIREDDGELFTTSIVMEPLIANHGQSILMKVAHHSDTQIRAMRVFCGKNASSRCKENPSREYRFPMINSTSQSEGIKVVYSNYENEHQLARKVIFATNRYLVPVYDPGYFGATQQGLVQLVASAREGANVCVFLQSKLIQYIIGASKWSSFRTEYESFAHIPFPRKKFASDVEIYAYFGLTCGEISRIEAWTMMHGKTFGPVQALCDPRKVIDTIINS